MNNLYALTGALTLIGWGAGELLAVGINRYRARPRRHKLTNTTVTWPDGRIDRYGQTGILETFLPPGILTPNESRQLRAEAIERGKPRPGRTGET